MDKPPKDPNSSSENNANIEHLPWLDDSEVVPQPYIDFLKENKRAIEALSQEYRDNLYHELETLSMIEDIDKNDLVKILDDHIKAFVANRPIDEVRSAIGTEEQLEEIEDRRDEIIDTYTKKKYSSRPMGKTALRVVAENSPEDVAKAKEAAERAASMARHPSARGRKYPQTPAPVASKPQQGRIKPDHGDVPEDERIVHVDFRQRKRVDRYARQTERIKKHLEQKGESDE